MRNGVLEQVAELQQLGRKDLGERWHSFFGTEPPAYSGDLLIGRLAYRIQELAFGGLAETTRNELRGHVPEDHLDTGAAAAARMDRRRRKNGIPVAGTRLIREWRGRRHEVPVVQGGFEYEGRRYRSLTGVANAITGSQWNDPAFFGLREPEKKKVS